MNSICNTCLQRFVILMDKGDHHLLEQCRGLDPGTGPCPRGCGGKINLAMVPEFVELWKTSGLTEPMLITCKELFQAVHGLPLPDEIPRDLEVVRSLLLANRILEVVLEKVDQGLYLNQLALENGVNIHLARGAHGAQVLKVTKPRKVT